MRRHVVSFGLVLALLLGPAAHAATIVPEVVSSFATPGGSILAMTWGDGSLWLADENLIIYRLDTQGQVQSQFSHTIGELSDLAWFEDTLWAHDGYNTYKLNLSGQIVETLDAAYWNNSGMEWAEGFLYVGNYNFSDIHKFDRSGNHIFSWPTTGISGHPEDMVYDGSSLWVTNSCEPIGKSYINQYSLTGQPGDIMNVSSLETCTWPPDRALAWDGRYFYYGGRLTVYKLNIGGDDVPPVASVVAPSGGEYWLLSDAGSPANTEVVTWTMSDNIRVCQVRASLWYSNDGGASYQESPSGGGLPATFGPGGSCTGAGELTTSLTYTLPTNPPSGSSGSLYKLQVQATDAAGNQLAIDPASGLNAVRSTNPFYIVRPNPDSVRTIILKNTARMQSVMGITPTQAAALDLKLQEFAAHPRVQGLVVDLGAVTDLTQLYAAWDADGDDPNKANAVLFGCHAPYPAGCPTDRERSGIHDTVRSLIMTSSASSPGSVATMKSLDPQSEESLEAKPESTYSGVKYLVLVGDDRIIPMARVQDRTALLPESSYPAGGDIRAIGSRVGEALAAGKYLTDDPLAVLDPISPGELDSNLFLPDLSVGRLVETPGEIVTTIATYISQDGILDLSALDPSSGHKVLVTGYDFLSNVAKQMRSRWKDSFGISTPNNSTAPVDGNLVEGNWGFGSLGARVTALRTSLAGNGGARYGVMAIAGHATHYEEGVPGTDPYDIQGLSTADIYGPDSCATTSLGAVALAGGVIYAVGCHGGLPVPGSCRTDADHSLDLPQTMLSRGVVAYIANSGYGWGLKHGIGYGARLAQIFTEQMTSGATIVVGDAVRLSKQRYYLETPRYDAYDEKSVMQWTLFGLPMYAVKTGIEADASLRSPGTGFTSREVGPAEAAVGERIGAVRVRRELLNGEQAVSRVNESALMARPEALPTYLTQLNLTFDFTAAGVYDKHDSSGTVLSPGPGCPDPNGCYYTLNGLVDRGTGSGDLPIQPYLIYDSRLSGTSQHGVLWKGGTYDEESGWTPIVAELVSNGGDGSNHGAAPRMLKLRPTAPRVVPGVDSPTCRPSELEVNSLTLTAGEALKPEDGDTVYSIARRYRTMDLEVFYFNNRTAPANNCDRSGPELGTGPFGGAYHEASGATVNWAVPAIDPAGVWRVVVVYSSNTVDGEGQGSWTPLELTHSGGGTYTGTVMSAGTTRLTYVIQAVDTRGNVTWLDYVSAQLPASGVALGVPKAVDVPVTMGCWATIASQPQSAVVAAGGSTTLSVTMNPSDGVYSYQWYRGASGDTSTPVGTDAAMFDTGAVATTTSFWVRVTRTDCEDLLEADSSTATVYVCVAPTIDGFAPASGPAGTSVVITGTNFTGTTSVRFNGVAASFVVNSPTQITATVPSGTTSGPIKVATTPLCNVTSSGTFTVAQPPTITSFTPASGCTGTTVTITGTNLSSVTAVKFNGVNATSFTIVSATSITAVAPASLSAGKVNVESPAGTAQSATNFTPAAGCLLTPLSLTATPVSATQINLGWTYAGTGHTGFKIERKLATATTWSQIAATTTPATTTYSNTALTTCTGYVYRVRAYVSTTNGAYSNEAAATTTGCLATPTSLTATPSSSTQINLAWSFAGTGHTGFKIERKLASGTTWSQIATTTTPATTAYSNMSLTACTGYVYRVRAYAGTTNNGPYSNEATATTTGCLATPGSLTATPVSATQINLSWSFAGTGHTGFKIERRLSSGTTWSQIVATTTPATTTYSSISLTGCTGYAYRVRAYAGSTNNGPYSNEATATTTGCLAAPTGLTATGVSNTQINLTWTYAGTGHTGFKIERRLRGNATWSQIIGTTTPATTTYSNTALVVCTEYEYRVRAYSGTTTNGPYSNEATGATLGCITAPASLVATPLSASSIQLTWTYSGTGHTGFKIERRLTTGTSWSQIATTTTPGTLTYTNTFLTGCTQYRYRVRAYTSTTANSLFSNEATATTTCP